MFHPKNQTKPTKTPNLTSQFTPHKFYSHLIHLPSHKPSKSKSKSKSKFNLTTTTTCSSSTPPPIKTLISILRTIPDWADTVQERGMQKNRTLYNHTNWVHHRSSLRHVRHFFSSFSSRVILSLVPPVLFFTSFAAVIAAYNSAVLLHFFPEFFPLLKASSLPYQLTAPALALLLVFRTEASYARFVEGKKAWTMVVAAAHDFARLVMAVVDTRTSIDFKVKDALLKYIIAFPIVLKDSKITCFHEGIGICEQLMGIPIPLSYTRLTSRFLVLWHLTLPIILWDDCHWIVVPATFISAASLFCIEEVGVLIEDPFPMLALNDLCRKAQTDIEEAIATENVIHAHLVAKQDYHSKEPSPNGRPNS
ncbi:voltage-dependent chloride channel 1, chloroplastic isoform X2 [Cicer arietinum]|uniref:voltage-dependent chloride channel 1, chloroplastic isoform X2 n=1 Tax=Cicer arietinum TaxID=3827 RepID=UPI003CC64079